MRKLIFIGFVALGALIGLLWAAKDDWATRAVMMVIGALFGAPVGAALSRIGKKGPPLKWEKDEIPGMGVTSEDLAANYWRDRGHPPFMKPPEVESPGSMHDPHRPG
jgi:hypothetical protein